MDLDVERPNRKDYWLHQNGIWGGHNVKLDTRKSVRCRKGTPVGPEHTKDQKNENGGQVKHAEVTTANTRPKTVSTWYEAVNRGDKRTKPSRIDHVWSDLECVYSGITEQMGVQTSGPLRCM